MISHTLLCPNKSELKMKSNLLLISFFFIITLSFPQSEREVINQIDRINTKALDHYKNNDIMQSFDAFNDAIRLSDSINDHYGNAVANFNIGKIYSYMLEFDDAETCYNKMLEYSLKIDDNYLISNSYMGLAELYEKKKQIVDVIPYYKKALEYALKTEVRDQDNQDKQNSILFNIRMDLCNIYLKRNKPSVALLYLLRAENNLNNSPFNSYTSAYYNYTYGRYLIHKELYNKANVKLELAIDLLEQNSDNKDLYNNLLFSKTYKKLSQSYAKLENNDMAYSVLLKHNNYREQFLNEEKVRQENIAKSKFYLAEYKQVAERANSERLIQEQITNKIKNVNIIITTAIFILFASLIMLYRNYRAKRKLSHILEVQNKQLEYAKNQAEKSSQLKTKFISNVSHELRTPLYGVVGLTSLLLKRNDLTERDSKFLKSIKYSGDYLLNLINDILQIGKIESQKVELKIVSVNIKELLNNIKDSFEYKLQETNNRINISIDNKIPEFVKCDSVRLSQVLINLIGNSIKFTENDTTSVKVELLILDDKYAGLRFAVKDNGPGIPKEDHKRIFENFSQVNENNNVNYQGTGLGLSITKNLIELFGGTIELESEVGKGSTFSFEVTFRVDNNAKAKLKKSEIKTVPLNGSYKILVAEDNKINQIVTQNILQKANFECDIVKNGLEALDALNNNKYDLILMDINMPIMNGNEATKKIRSTKNNIPIIALTAADIEEVREDYRAIGYDDIITKPFDNHRFFQTILSNIQKSKSQFNKSTKLVKVS